MKKSLGLMLGILLLVGCNTNFVSNSLSSTNSQSTSKNSSTPQVNITNSSNSSVIKEDGYIYDENDLINIKNDLDGTYYLANDIVLSNKWVTIGDSENPFTGTLEGNGFTIKNMSINSSLTVTSETLTTGREFNSVGGLIGYLTGTIKNVNLEDYNISIENQSTSISGVNTSTTEYKIFIGGLVGINEGNIINCSASGNIDVSSTSVIARGRLGGLVGKNDALIEECSTSGSITGNFTHENIRAGGLVGATENGTIKQSLSSTSVDITNLNGKAIGGGLVGLVEFSTIENCYATGDITANSNKAATAGGLIGLIDATIAGTTIVKNCYATGSLTAIASVKSSYAGGLIGNCEVLINGTSGLIGEVNIMDCAYGGSSLESKAANKAHGGAIISCIEGNSADYTITIDNCNYLSGISLNIQGTVESKENTQGHFMETISDLIASIEWDTSIWDTSNNNNLPILK